MKLSHNPLVRDGDLLGPGAHSEIAGIAVYPDSVRPDILDVIPPWGRPDRGEDTWSWVFTFMGEEAVETLLPLLQEPSTPEEFDRVLSRHHGEDVGQVWPQYIAERYRSTPLHIVGHSDRAVALLSGHTKRKGRRRGRPHKMKIPSPSLYLMDERALG